jgi:hypothetical protein
VPRYRNPSETETSDQQRERDAERKGKKTRGALVTGSRIGPPGMTLVTGVRGPTPARKRSPPATLAWAYAPTGTGACFRLKVVWVELPEGDAAATPVTVVGADPGRERGKVEERQGEKRETRNLDASC